jgi:DHA2 family multidrug resistance protein
VTTLLDRRTQHHSSNLSSHLSASNPNFQHTLQGLTQTLQTRGFSHADAMHRAYAMIQNSVTRQSTMLAYIENFWLLAIGILCMVPLVFLMKKPHAGGPIAVH